MLFKVSVKAQFSVKPELLLWLLMTILHIVVNVLKETPNML